MTRSSDFVTVDLTDREREFIQQALEQWALSAADAPFPFQVLGLSTWGGVRQAHPASWARVLFLTEITWASDLVGAGPDFATVTGCSDTEAVSLLRGLQRRRKIGGHTRAKLLFPNGGRTRTAEEIEEDNRYWEMCVASSREGSIPPGCKEHGSV
jgi:hypothetical protein